ncbi:beta-ketoacyl synthase domain-containing [Pyrenophora seminiperda CCB06]|uniref:Beta-ketoacyl synthase domain-containing n=1 Tax=Pyrenophora seminiperda CCB06 TaxID=1302712 RepID=A0A3M7LUP5_9PLEO|nr:beta-ketoacyl synthase domain-containing [Pyrenophora seminiperda CCB06]
MSKPIAIIGIAFRGPGDARDPEAFYRMLVEGRSARTEIPKDRYNVDAFYHPDPERLGSIQQRHAHFLEQDFRVFDAPFFSVTPKEAKAMDPTHRMLLEAAYEGFENAGLSLDRVSGTQTSCYIGTFTADFPNMQARDNEGPSIYHATGMSSSLASNRLSWFYNLKGPSLTTDTACSSSLTAFHLACQSIRTGEAEMSVVGGANLMFGPDMSILLGAAKILSADGKSKMWDANANGFARGEGFGITILKPLDAAIRDGDTIRAVVLATATNEDGRTPGISLPNFEAQQELIRGAYQMADVDPGETSYVEAHGTGTQAGDPLEARAILKTVGSVEGRKSDLYVGSVKTNIGHLEGAAGVAGVIKAALAVERGLIPQNLWFEKINPDIDLPVNVKVPTKLTPWPHSGPRRASINSFGFGGANAHVILEDAASFLSRHGLKGRHATASLLPSPGSVPDSYSSSSPSSSASTVTDETTSDESSDNVSDVSSEVLRDLHPISKLLVLSSNDQEGVKRNAERLHDYLGSKTSTAPSFISDLAFTLNSKRTTLPWKSYAVCSNISTLREKMSNLPPVVRSSASAMPRIAYVFTGQGAQWHAMGKGLSVYTAFSESMQRSEALLKSFGCPWSLGEELGRTEAECRLRETDYSQPACTAIQIALVDLLNSFDISPVAVLGHSSGEIAAAYAAGFIDQEAAVKIAWLRGQVSKEVPKNGGMLAVSASADSLQHHLDGLKSGRAVVECFNSTKACTITGDAAAISEIETVLKEAQVACTRLPMDLAYHSFHMESARKKYESALEGIAHGSTSTVPMFSSVTGTLVTSTQMKPSYWVDNLVSPVNFVAATRSLLSHPQESKTRKAFANLFVEIGPHSALRSYLLDIFSSENRAADLTYTTILRRNFDGAATALEAMGHLWAQGYTVNLEKVNNISLDSSNTLVDLPPYAWNHKPFWDESALSRQYRLRKSPRLDLVGYRLPGTPEHTWRNFLRCNENPWIREHKVQGDILYPGAGMLVMAIEAVHQLAQEISTNEIHGFELRDVSIDTALRVPDTEKGIEVMTQLHNRRTGTRAAPSDTLYEFTVSSWSDEMNSWTAHARGLISVTLSTFSPSMEKELALSNERYMSSLTEARRICQKPARSFLYDTVETIGMNYGPTFRNMTELFAGPNASYGVIKVPDTKAIMPKSFEFPHIVHPATLDSVLHLVFPSISGEGQELNEAVVPRSFERIFKWHLDADLLAPSQIKEIIYKRTLKSKDDDSVLDLLEFVCLVYIYRILDWFQTEEGKAHVPQDGFWKSYVEWMHDTVKQFPPLLHDAETEMQKARQRIILSESGDITVQMVDRIGQNLSRIFTHEVEALQCMTEGDLLYSFYRGAFGTSFNTNVAEYVGLIADKQPGVRILEIGAGTGGTTYHVLERLRNPDGSSKAAQYYFTDISPGFLAKAADRFNKDASIMQFSTLNIENSPIEQGFSPESFDLIVCANVMHATKSIQETLAHCKLLLKPSGRLVLSEVTIKRIFSGFIMGPLPGWWLGEADGRMGGPLLNTDEWNMALKTAGFSGVDVDVRGDRDTSKEPVSLIISTKPEKTVPSLPSCLILTPSTEASNELAHTMQKTFASAGHEISVAQWNDVTKMQVEGKYCICLAEWENAILANLTDGNWDRLREVVLSSAGTLWITGGGALDAPHPMKSLMVGLARAIRNEDAGVRLACLDLEAPSIINYEKACQTTLKVAQAHIRGDGTEGEFAARGDMVYLPRVERTLELDASLRKYEAKGDPEMVSFKGCGRPLKLTIKTPGLLDTFQWEEDETYHTPLPDDWTEVEVKAVGLNFKDVLVALGNLAENKLGVDASGIVTRIGSAVTDFKVGDRVMTASCDTFATYVRFPAKGAIAVPSAMSFEEAASMPLIFLTAYYALVTTGGIVAGEKILIHAAAGAVGQAAIMIAQAKGAEIFATVGADIKKQLLIEQYGIPETHIFSSRDTSFVKGVFRATEGQGVDLVLNSLAGEALRLSWTDCLAKFGRFLEIGKADLFANTGLDMKPLLDNKSYIGVNLLDFENNPTPRAVALWNDTAKMIHEGAIKPIAPLQIFTMAEVEKAFRHMQAGKHMGKVVVRVDDEDVRAVPRIPRVRIHPDATYLIAGLGGITREIARWLAEKGAQYLVFLSRSAASNTDNKAFASQLQKTYNVTPLAYDCDVSDKTALQAVLDDLTAKGLPPIKGCATGAMVLHDTLFDKMTADHVRTTAGPKVHGTWNLHELLPRDMDFFVMLSSLAGVMGHRGQGNYGCGNNFQDEFASFRRSQGLPALTIDIGYLLSVGFVAEHDEYVDHVKAMGLKVMHTSDLHGLLATAIEGPSHHPGQIMCGLPFNEHDDNWYWMADARFAALRNLAAGSSANAGQTISLHEELKRCGTVNEEAVQLITAAIVQRLASLMMTPEADIDAGRPLSAYGVDSLVAVEVRNWIAREMAVECSVFDVMQNVPMTQLAKNLAEKSKLLLGQA